MPNDLHYAFPHAAYLWLAIFLIAGFIWSLYNYRERFFKRFGTESQQNVIVPRTAFSFWFKAIAACAAWLAASLALMQPEGNGHYPVSKEEGVPQKITEMKNKEVEGIARRRAQGIIFLIDASASMAVQDMRGGESRLDFAKEVVDGIISRLKGESVALSAYTSVVTQLSPLTMDYLFVRIMLKQMQINEGDVSGSDLFEAIAATREEYFSSISPALKTLIILSDGGDNRLEELKGEERQKELNTLLGLVGNAEELNLSVYTIGLGSLKGGTIPNLYYQGKTVSSALEEGILKQISKKGRGKYIFANEFTADEIGKMIVEDIVNLPARIAEYKVKRVSDVKGEGDLIYDLFYQIPLGVALMLLGFIWLLPDTWTPLKNLTQRTQRKN